MKKLFLILVLQFLVLHYVLGQQELFIPNGENTLHTMLYGDKSREAIILLHGGPGVPDAMQQVVDVLKENYYVVTFEQRGAGLSSISNKDYSMNAYVSDIEAIADSLDLTSFHLFGHSWGGLYAQIYAEQHPDRLLSLFLCSSGTGTGEVWKKCEREVLRSNKESCANGDWLRMGYYSVGGMLGSDKAYQKLFALVIRNYHQDFVDTVIIDTLELSKINSDPVKYTRKYIADYPILKKVDSTTYPVFITFGDQDIYGESQQEVVQRYWNAELVIIPDSGHYPWVHQEGAFNEYLEWFYKLK